MKVGIILLILALLALAPGLCYATIIDFYTDGTIEDGDDYERVNVFADASVSVTGGEIRNFYSYESSWVNMASGDMSWLYLFDTSEVDISGGVVGRSLTLSDSSTVNLVGGQITDYVAIFDSATLNVYGYGFDFARDGGMSESGWLSGYWVDGTGFAMYLRNLPEPFPGIQVGLHVIPEPSTVLLFVLGGVLLKKRH